MKKNKSRPVCGKCLEEEETEYGLYLCEKCGLSLCETHRRSHARAKKTSRHVLLLLDSEITEKALINIKTSQDPKFQKEIDSLKSQLTIKDKQISSNKAEWKEYENSYTQIIENFKKEKDAFLQKCLSDTKTQKQTLENQLTTMESQLLQLKNHNQIFNNLQTELSETKQRLVQSEQTKQIEISRLNAQVSYLSNQISSLNTLNTQLMTERTHLMIERSSRPVSFRYTPY